MVASVSAKHSDALAAATSSVIANLHAKFMIFSCETSSLPVSPQIGIDERDNRYDGYLIMVASTRRGSFERGVIVAVTLRSAEVDTRANGAIQVVGEPSDTAPDGTVEIHLVHPIECRVRKMSKVPPEESSGEKAVGAERAVGSVVGQRHEAPHVAEMEFGKRTVLPEISDKTACKEDGLLSSHLGSRWKRPSVHARKA